MKIFREVTTELPVQHRIAVVSQIIFLSVFLFIFRDILEENYRCGYEFPGLE